MKITWRYCLNLFTATLAALGGLLWFFYRQTLDYIHPRRSEPPSGDHLRKNRNEFREIELHTSDGVRLAA